MPTKEDIQSQVALKTAELKKIVDKAMADFAAVQAAPWSSGKAAKVAAANAAITRAQQIYNAGIQDLDRWAGEQYVALARAE